ncbi:MAG: hydroxyacylglutathione hydrolase [Alphaproteobacteria bacterium]
MPLEIHQFPCLKDNYGYLIHDRASGQTAAVDTPDAARILDEAGKKGWRITHILNTHHHFDHAGGNLAIKEKTGCTIIGPRAEAAKIPGIDVSVGEGDRVEVGSSVARVFDVPGHTSGHIAYWFESDKVAFVGDTLFALGCGRLFEGTAQQMWSSLSKLAGLPGETKVYCAHEYTQSNARFALTVEPHNSALIERAKRIDEARAKGEWTVPSTIALELQTNPFLRAASTDLQSTIGVSGDPVKVFARTRALKDEFRG